MELGARRVGTSAVTSPPRPSILALQSARSSWVTAWHSSSTCQGPGGAGELARGCGKYGGQGWGEAGEVVRGGRWGEAYL